MVKVNFLFWNLKNQPLLDLIVALAHEHQTDVLMLTEADQVSATALLEALNQSRVSKFSLFQTNARSLKILAKFPRRSIRPIRDASRYSLLRIIPPVGTQIIVGIVHLQSKLHWSAESQMSEAFNLIRYLTEAEAKYGHARTIVCGDFNMHPFDPGMVIAGGFHATMSKQIASKGFRIIDNTSHTFFYNPMWNLLGDTDNGPPGTYFYRQSEPLAYFWHMFDQVLIRPELLSRFDNNDLAILTMAGATNLVTSEGRPRQSVASDHLPLRFSVDVT